MQGLLDAPLLGQAEDHLVGLLGPYLGQREAHAHGLAEQLVVAQHLEHAVVVKQVVAGGSPVAGELLLGMAHEVGADLAHEQFEFVEERLVARGEGGDALVGLRHGGDGRSQLAQFAGQLQPGGLEGCSFLGVGILLGEDGLQVGRLLRRLGGDAGLQFAIDRLGQGMRRPAFDLVLHVAQERRVILVVVGGTRIEQDDDAGRGIDQLEEHAVQR